MFSSEPLLPRTAWTTEIHCHIGGEREASMSCKLSALISSERSLQFLRQLLHLGHECVDHAHDAVSLDGDQRRDAAATLDPRDHVAVVPLPHQIYIPVPRHRLIFDLGGPFADRDRSADASTGVASVVQTGLTGSVSRAQVRLELGLSVRLWLNRPR